MNGTIRALCACSLVGLGLLQTPLPPYRGFSAGMSYRAFAEQARALASNDLLRCNTSANTAQLMECGVSIRDPSDGASFSLRAYVLEQKILTVSFGDSGNADLVSRAQRDLVRRFGPAHPIGHDSWEWRSGHRFARLTWRGRESARWIYVSLVDQDLMNGIARYAKAARPSKPAQ